MSKAESQDSSQRIELARQTLTSLSSWITMSDAKAAAILAFIVGLVGYIGSQSETISAVECRYGTGWQFALLLTFVIFFLASSIITAYCAFKVLNPDIKPRSKSLIFFGSIAQMNIKKYKSRFKKLSVKDIEDVVLSQTYVNSQIANNKFRNVQSGIKWLMVASAFWIVTTIFLLFLS